MLDTNPDAYPDFYLDIYLDITIRSNFQNPQYFLRSFHCIYPDANLDANLDAKLVS